MTGVPALPVLPARPAGRASSVRIGVLALGAAAIAACGQGGLETPIAISVDDVPPAVPRSGAVVFSEAPQRWGQDPLVLNTAAITGDTLELSLSYAGGCARHVVTLVVSERFLESDPVQLPVSLAHDANGDSCEAWLTHDYEFDLTPVRDRYRQAYADGPGRVVLLLDEAPDGTLLYVFS